MTARQYAQKSDRFKFHRVVKLLRELEQKELDRVIVKEAINDEKPEEPE